MTAVQRWLGENGWTPFPFQEAVWRAYAAGESGLIHAPTGTGKTLAAWLGPVAEALEEQPRATEAPPLRVLWITPLRALAADTEAALRAPLDALGLPWTLQRRTGDLSSALKAKQRTRLPTTLITTPESLSLLLSRKDAAEHFAHLQAVIVDEWHELLGSKRGVQTELCLARLRRWRPGLRVWGLSATIGNLDDARDVLLPGGGGRIVQGRLPKETVIDALLPARVERFPWAGHLGLKMLDQVIDAIEEGETCLLFTNTRSQTELWYQALLEARPDYAGVLAVHHGSLDREVRAWVEQALGAGRLRCVVCTSSLDLGVDFAPVDRVIQVGSPKGVARLLQRAGRSGHQPGGISRVTGVPTNAFELIEFAAAREEALAGRIEARVPLRKPLDLLAQHAITIALGGGFTSEDLYHEVRSTHAYRGLTPLEWAWVLRFLESGGPSLGAYPEYHRLVHEDGRYTVHNTTVARRHRMSIGTITSDAMLVCAYLGGGKLGFIEENFAARLMPGDRFFFAGKSLEFVRIKDMKVLVRKAGPGEASVPRWMGGRMPLSTQLGAAVRRKLAEAARGDFDTPEMRAVEPVLEVQARWSHIPREDELLIERFTTRAGHHLIFYPFEGRLVHEGLSALLAWRIAQLRPITFTFSSNDYGFELLSPDYAPLDEALAAGLFDTARLLGDIAQSMNTSEMARRKFREIARVAGLVFTGYPSARKTERQVQVSSGLLYDVFAKYDPDNLLLAQAAREVLEENLEHTRLAQTLARLAQARTVVTTPQYPTPLSFPLIVDRTRGKLSSEKLADRIRRMQAQLEQAAHRTAVRRGLR